MNTNKVTFLEYRYGTTFPKKGRKKGDHFLKTDEGKFYEFNGRKFVKHD